MGIGDLFKGYMFFQLASSGIGLVVGSIIMLFYSISYWHPALFFGFIVFLLIGLGLLYVSYRIYQSEKTPSKKGTAKIGYSKGLKKDVCPDCGEREMDVSFDGSGVCDNCGHATRDYHSEI